ncbi:MAG: choice-of-anchor tandem repeat NxxGxxAF-containing protein [Planctomycetota bacterium]
MHHKALTFLLLFLTPSLSTAQLSIRTVALSTDECPGTHSGQTLGHLGPDVQNSYFQPGPAINKFGQVAFLAQTNCVDKSIWSDSTGGLALVAKYNDALPGFGPFTYMDSGPRITDDGDVIFQTINGLNPGYISNRGGSKHVVARGGAQAPGTPPGTNFIYFGGWDGYSHSPSVSRNGVFAFPGFLNTQSRGIWTGTEDNITARTLVDGQVPGHPAGTIFDDISSLQFSPSANRYGRVTILASAGSSSGVWSVAENSARLVFPTTLSIPEWSSGGILISNYPKVNDQGDIVVKVRPWALGGDDTSVLAWDADDGKIRHLASTSLTHAPGTEPGVVFSNTGDNLPAINGRGQVVFGAELTGPGVTPANKDGFWAEDLQGFLKLLVRTGMEAPGLGQGATFMELWGEASINALGTTVFYATTVDNGIYRSGYWAANPDDGTLYPIVLSRQLIEVRSGVMKEVDSIGLSDNLGSRSFSSGGQDGLPTGLNENNQAAFRIAFTDGTSGVFVVTIPEPSSLAILALCMLSIFRHQARRACSAPIRAISETSLPLRG